MTAKNRVMQVLDDFAVPYNRMPHREAFTAGQVAQESKVPPKAMAKVVVARDTQGRHVMAVLPASTWLDLPALEEATGLRPLALANERELLELFPDCEAGAMPPFGGPYGMPTYVDECLRAAAEIHFQPGNHHETVSMAFAEYQRLAAPAVGRFCLHRRRGAA